MNTPARRVAGALLLLPALLALLWSYVLPTLSTVVESFQRGSLLGDRVRPVPVAEEGAGLDNYERAFDTGLAGGLGTALLMALVPLFAALVAAPLLAVAADRAGRAARLLTRVLLALPLALYAPSAVAMGWFLDRLREDGAPSFGSRSAAVSVYGWMCFGLVVAIAATAFLAVLRGRTGQRRPGAALLAVGGVLGLGVLAVTLQAVTVPLLLATRPGPPVANAVLRSLQVAQIGPGAAASVILLVLLAVLGLAAVGLLLATRTRIEVDPAAPGRPAQPFAVVAVAAGGVVLLAIVGYALFPWLRDAASLGADLPRGPSAGRLVLNTWLPPLISAIVGVGIAAAGGYAIGVLRPLGRWSEALLLPFAPWLFVGTGPLALANYLRARDLEQLNTFVGLIPPTWLSIPALVLFTVFFRARRARVLTALPLAALALLMVWLLSAQDILWPYLIGQTPEHRTAPLALLTSNRALAGAEDAAVGLVLPLPLLLLFAAAFIALQIVYLDRLAVRTGRDEFRPVPAGPPAPPWQQPPPGSRRPQQEPPAVQAGHGPAAPPHQAGQPPHTRPEPEGGQRPAGSPPPG